jgi:glycyl-tRNA synthetase beta subunit
MKGLELLEQNPNVAKLICSYYLEIMLESLKDEGLPEEFKDSVREQGIDNDKIGAIIDGNPRNLFDFFDNHKIIIQIRYSREFQQFVPEVNGVSSYTFSKRKDAEGVAIEEAILMLESSLTKSVSDKENS